MEDEDQSERLERLEALLDEQQSTIERQQERIESQREELDRLHQSQQATVELVADGGDAKVIGHHTASDGETYGVLGEVDSDEGYGLYTPDDAKIEGAIDTAETDFVVKAGTEDTEDAQNVVIGHEESVLGDDVVGATISGGGKRSIIFLPNRVYSNYGTVGGGFNNQAGIDDGDPTTSVVATVGGGRNNEASGRNSTAGGGFGNEASGRDSTVAGGRSSEASGWSSTVGGGLQNEASGRDSTVGGGVHNEALGEYATISGGGPTDPDADELEETNVVYDDYGTIGGGGNNQVGIEDTEEDAKFATVAGGEDNEASGSYAFAAGHKAKAEHDGAVVFGDSTDNVVTSETEDQVTFQQDVRASGWLRAEEPLVAEDGLKLHSRVEPNENTPLPEGTGMLYISEGGGIRQPGDEGDLIYTYNDDGDIKSTVVQSKPE